MLQGAIFSLYNIQYINNSQLTLTWFGARQTVSAREKGRFIQAVLTTGPWGPGSPDDSETQVQEFGIAGHFCSSLCKQETDTSHSKNCPPVSPAHSASLLSPNLFRGNTWLDVSLFISITIMTCFNDLL